MTDNETILRQAADMRALLASPAGRASCAETIADMSRDVGWVAHCIAEDRAVLRRSDEACAPARDGQGIGFCLKIGPPFKLAVVADLLIDTETGTVSLSRIAALVPSDWQGLSMSRRAIGAAVSTALGRVLKPCLSSGSRDAAWLGRPGRDWCVPSVFDIPPLDLVVRSAVTSPSAEVSPIHDQVLVAVAAAIVLAIENASVQPIRALPIVADNLLQSMPQTAKNSSNAPGISRQVL